MVDCRPASGAAPHEPHSAPNGASPPDNHHNQLNQAGGSGDMGSHVVTSPAARASTPAAVPQHVPYAPQYQSPALPPVPLGVPMGAPYMSYVCGGAGKGLVWMPPPPPPLPHHVNPHALKSIQANGADLPMNDIPTLRYYFNLGVDCMWAAYGPPPPPPRHYSPRDIAQDMQQMSIQERGNNHVPDMGHKHKGPPTDKPMQTNGKGNGQRSLLGPRFNKRGNGQEGNQNPNHNHNQNKNHNNNNNNHMPNKGPNNRTYYSRNEPRHAAYPGEGEPLPEAPMLTLPYIHYPPPVYPVQYYPVDTNDPAMMGMMGGMQYCGVGYEEPLEYPHYYPPPPYPAPLPHLPPQHEHK